MSCKRIGFGSFEFMRAACATGIVAYHCAHEVNAQLITRTFLRFPNNTGSFGYMLVTVFFMLSGGLLWYNYHDRLGNREDVVLFFQRRWVSLFPSFYIAYFSAFCYRTITSGSMLANKKPATFILTLLGMDGYLNQVFDTWYLLGEWFLGAIILCYLAFPILNWFFERYPAATTITAIALFLGTMDLPMLGQDPFRNVFSCIASFVTGMTMLRYQTLLDRQMLVPSALIMALFTLLPIGINESMQIHLAAFGCFIILFQLGRLVMKRGGWIADMVNGLSAITYEIFLVHHVIYYQVVRIYRPNGIASWLGLFLLVFALSCLSALLVSCVRNWLVRRAFPNR